MLLSACLVVLVPGKEVSKSLLPRKKKKTLNLSEYRSRGPPPVEGGKMACKSSGLEESQGDAPVDLSHVRIVPRAGTKPRVSASGGAGGVHHLGD